MSDLRSSTGSWPDDRNVDALHSRTLEAITSDAHLLLRAIHPPPCPAVAEVGRDVHQRHDPSLSSGRRDAVILPQPERLDIRELLLERECAFDALMNDGGLRGAEATDQEPAEYCRLERHCILLRGEGVVDPVCLDVSLRHIGPALPMEPHNHLCVTERHFLRLEIGVIRYRVGDVRQLLLDTN